MNVGDHHLIVCSVSNVGDVADIWAAPPRQQF